MSLEEGVSFLTGTKVLYWLPEALTTGVSNSEGKRTELAQGTQGDAVIPPQLSVQLRFPECALLSPSTSTEQAVPITAGGDCRQAGANRSSTIHRPGGGGRVHFKCSP